MPHLLMTRCVSTPASFITSSSRTPKIVPVAPVIPTIIFMGVPLNSEQRLHPGEHDLGEKIKPFGSHQNFTHADGRPHKEDRQIIHALQIFGIEDTDTGYNG